MYIVYCKYVPDGGGNPNTFDHGQTTLTERHYNLYIYQHFIQLNTPTFNFFFNSDNSAMILVIAFFTT